jgi:DNA sulfur modification protein DndD
MLLKKIVLCNFRQFYGKQEIEFSESNQNVTVIYGANGRGKTSLYRALMFCLYGIKRLSQDPKESQKDINLVNKVALDESQQKEVEAFVEVELIHNNQKHVLKRSLLGMKLNEKEIEQPGSVKLSITDNTGNTYIINNPDEISSKINSMLDKRVREYFLFDGEKIERLTRVSKEQKLEIEVGIKNLLNIDRLDTALKGISLLLRNIDKQLKNKSTGDYQKQLIKLEDLNNAKESMSDELKNLNEEIRLARNEKNDIDNKLKEFESISGLLKEREETQKKRNNILKEREDLLTELVSTNDDVGLILAEKIMTDAEKHIGRKIQNQEIPSQIRNTLVQKVLNERVCICNRKIEENTDAYNAILKWKNRIVDENIESGLINTYKEIGATKEFIKYKAYEIEVALQNYSRFGEQIEQYEEELKAISDEIRSHGNKDVDIDIPSLEQSREEILKKIAKIEQKIHDVENNLKKINDEIEIAEKNLKELGKKEQMKNDLVYRRDLSANAKDALGEIYNEFTSEIKTKLSGVATEVFKILIDEEGKKTFQEIQVTDDYSLQLIDWRGKPFLSNISAGQRQITSISFILALAKLAGGKKILDVPLFMDTPFGRLSGEHRDNLIDNIPNFANQWILLTTDTEFSKEEAKNLRLTGKWGKIYVLEGKKPFISIIKEQDVDTFQPVRKRIKMEDN